MIVITGHNMLDFDALASMTAARKLYPTAELAFSGLIAKSVQEFAALYKDLLDIKDIKTMDQTKIKQLVVVDTANPKRLPGFENLLEQPGLVLHVYDHHEPRPGDLEGDFRQVEAVGAAATLLVEHIRAAAVELSEFEATVIALGIYADTGSLIYDTTTTRDVAAVGWLLEQGANLSSSNASPAWKPSRSPARKS